jgi:O-antigen/teichoic acid export membrane protein
MTLKEKTTKGLFWSFVDQFSAQGISFIIGIIIARILNPADYGMLGMLAIFMAVANTFIVSGFGAALVQKSNRSQVDFSTVFLFNLVVAAFLYCMLFIAAPFIANFYELPELTLITRVIGLTLLIGAISIVPRTILNINIDFKTQTKISIISSIISGSIGVTLAYSGYGVWALIVQNISAVVLQTVLLVYFIKWKPSFVFSNQSFNQLFGFGSKLLASALLDTIYNNIYLLVIGKRFSADDLGQYTRAQQLENFPASNITNIIQRVTFPVLCSIQDDQTRLIDAYRKLIKMAAFLIFPIMFLLVLVAKPLILILLTDKWLPAVELFQILCFSGMLYPIHAINLNILQAQGRSDLFFKLEIWKKSLGVCILIMTLPFGLKILLWGQVATSFIGLFMNTWYTGKLYNYGIWKQGRDIIQYLLTAIIICFFLFYMISFFDSYWYKLIIGGFFYTILYIGISWIFKSEELKQIVTLIFLPIQKINRKS